jgi:hypothetical protein
MNASGILLILAIFLFGIDPIFSQLGEKKEKFPLLFGLQARILQPSEFLGPHTSTLLDGGFSSSLNQKTGFSYGALIRADYTKSISLEVGLNYIQRQFNAQMSYTDSITSISDSNKLTFINYEIPLTGIVKIQMGQKLFATAGLGPSFSYKPTNVALIDQPGGPHTFYHSGTVKKFGIDLNAQIGFEFRTRKSGIYYIGGAVKVPTNYLFNWGGKYSKQNSSQYFIDFTKVNGAFLTIDLRYYLPKIKNSGLQFIKGPIE